MSHDECGFCGFRRLPSRSGEPKISLVFSPRQMLVISAWNANEGFGQLPKSHITNLSQRTRQRGAPGENKERKARSIPLGPHASVGVRWRVST
jgi:hypothetical protein